MRILFAVLVLGVVAGVGMAQADRVEPSLRDARAVCRLVAEGRAEFIDVPYGSAYGEETATAQIDIDNDGDDDAVQILSGGTSHTPWIQSTEEIFESDFSDGEHSFGPWSGQLRLLRHRGRVYEVFYSDAATLDFPVYIGIHLPDAVNRLVCWFDSASPLPRLRATEGHEAAAPICEAVEARLRSDADDFPFTPVAARPGAIGESEVESEAVVDFMNDGTPHRLAHSFYFSGAGPGCDAKYYQLADPDGPEGVARPLYDLQTTEPEGRYPVRLSNGYAACHLNAPRFHRINGSVVLEQRFPGERPQRHDQQFWWVSRVENGEAVRICEATVFNAAPRTIQYGSQFYPQAR